MRVLSIEIGTDLTHVIEVDYKTKNPHVYKWFSFETPEGVVVEEGIRKSDTFKRTLQKNLTSQKIATRKALFVINSSKIANREIEIPMVKENRIQGLLQANSSEYFPVDLSQYQLVYRTIEGDKKKKKAVSKDKNEEATRKLFVLAVPNDLVRSYEEFSAFCSLELVGMDYVGNSIFQTTRKSVRDRLSCNVKIDEHSTMITIVNHGEVEIQRTIFYGFSEAAALVEESGLFADRKNKSTKEILEEELLLRPKIRASTSAETDPLDVLKSEVTASFRPMLSNISRVIDYYLSRRAGAEIKECLLVGNGANIRGLAQLMSMELNMSVVCLTKERANLSGVPRGMSIMEYISCYGAAIAPLTFRLGLGQTGTKSARGRGYGVKIAKVVFAVCVIGTVGMAAVVGAERLKLTAQLAMELSEQESYSYIQDIYDTYQATQARYDDVMAMDSNMQTVSDNLADAIDGMEQKMPSNIMVTSLTSDDAAVSIEFKINSKKEAAKVLQALKEFDIFADVSTGGLTDMVDESGNRYVIMTAVCKYVGGTDDTEDTEIVNPEQDALDAQQEMSGQKSTEGGDTANE